MNPVLAFSLKVTRRGTETSIPALTAAVIEESFVKSRVAVVSLEAPAVGVYSG